MFEKLPRRLCLSALVLTLSACGGGGSADPMQGFTDQTLAWQSCDPGILVDMGYLITDLGDRVRCANMRVPLDYADPGKGEAVVALLRVAAEDPRQRAGSIQFNPGGPGGDGLSLAAYFGALWAGADPDSPLGKPLKQLSMRYDLIGFSPRGVGASSRLYCASNEMSKEVKLPSADRSQENIDNMLYNARLTAEACRKNPLTRYINTEQTVHDMDLMRHLLGDRQLNYVGYSYGTWLGAWYASRFPQRVGRMLLDSNMNVAGTFDDAELMQPMGYQRILEQVLAPYAARHPGVFRLGASAAEVRAVYGALPSSAREFLANRMPLNKSRDVLPALMMLGAAKGVGELLETFHPIDADNLKLLVGQRDFSDQADLNLLARAIGNLIVDFHFRPPFKRVSLELAPGDAVFRTVVCNDTPSRQEARFWIDQGNDQAARYPLRGGAVTSQPCLYWGGPNAVKPPLSATADAAPILMVQAEYDGATPTEGALTGYAALPNAAMIYVTDEYSHGVFPYSTACVDQAVADYFVSGAIPGRGKTLTCAGKPLPGDVPPFAGKRADAGGQPPADAGGQPYTDPARAAELIDGIHRIVGGADRGF